MPDRCPQCRAVYHDGDTCADRFNRSQLAELDEPAKYAVHHLSVPCYLLQHNAYSRAGWLEVRTLLAKFVREGWTPAIARRSGRRHAGSDRRTWSFTKGEKLAGVDATVWQRTIADVRLDPPDAYCADVLAWAEQILVDSEALVGAAGRPDHNRRP